MNAEKEQSKREEMKLDLWAYMSEQGFSLLARDHGEKEEEESFELRNQDQHTRLTHEVSNTFWKVIACKKDWFMKDWLGPEELLNDCLGPGELLEDWLGPGELLEDWLGPGIIL
ncbi:hypothetical protein DNTS_014362 [Danionella cerebrum]|uniref:Uncharacterized protein n=1 Tax=Danionella cerebrum TaxID=2873325 RepID=A0A553QTB9_9TELE|nr:hypothetical protein DNTS_014362 [Danionella translucida]